MNTCGTCKHRGKSLMLDDYENFTQKDSGYFLCDRAKHNARYGLNKIAQGQKMFVIDGSGYFAALCVEDDFGCNEWEVKP